jgi:hypothetical protein
MMAKVGPPPQGSPENLYTAAEGVPSFQRQIQAGPFYHALSSNSVAKLRARSRPEPCASLISFPITARSWLRPILH